MIDFWNLRSIALKNVKSDRVRRPFSQKLHLVSHKSVFKMVVMLYRDIRGSIHDILPVLFPSCSRNKFAFYYMALSHTTTIVPGNKNRIGMIIL